MVTRIGELCYLCWSDLDIKMLRKVEGVVARVRHCLYWTMMTINEEDNEDDDEQDDD